MFARRYPDYYQGTYKNKNYFEIWYYKISDRTSEHVIAFIPGIIRGMNDHGHQSFLQILDGTTNKSTYISYGVDSLTPYTNTSYIKLGNHEFGLKSIRLNHYDSKYQIVGELNVVDLVQWPDSALNPGSMGYLNYVPFLKWRNQVTLLYGEILGKLLINNKEVDFTGGRIYIEKMWGKNFPDDYIWVQSGDFCQPRVSFTCRIARLSILGIPRKVFFAAFYLNGVVYKFTSLQHAKIKVEQLYNELKLTFVHHDLQLTATASYERDDYIDWRGPKNGELVLPLRHTLTGQIRVELVDLFKNKTIYSGIGETAGIEIKGKVYPQKEKK